MTQLRETVRIIDGKNHLRIKMSDSCLRFFKIEPCRDIQIIQFVANNAI